MMIRLVRRALALAAATVLSALNAPGLHAQRPAGRTDTTTLRPDLPNIAALVATLPSVTPAPFDEQRALWLGALPLSCLDRLQPRPNPRGRANSGTGYFWGASYSLVPDHDRLRAFWGCNDWHSAVASTWVAVRTLETYPNSVLHELTREKLNAHLGRSNLDGEMQFFRATAAAINPIPSASQTGLFERPYGFAWLLELDAELRTWPDSQARRWTSNLAPLASWMADSLGAYYVALVEPVRSGAQNNTAQSMTLALDYADAVHDERLRRAIVTSARKLLATMDRTITRAGQRRT